MTSPSGGQNDPAIAARAASGIAIAANGTATMFAGTLIRETVPNAGSSTGNVASWAATVAVKTKLNREVRSLAVRPFRTSTRAREATTESRNPSDSICRGCTRTIAPAASRIKVTKSGRLPTRNAATAAVATIAALTDGEWAPETSAYAQIPNIVRNCQDVR